MADLITIAENSPFRRIQKMVTQELEDRLRDEPEGFENKDLIRLFTDMAKVEVAARKKMAEEAPKLARVFDMIEGLPKERQVQLLLDAAQRLGDQAEAQGVTEALTQIVGEQEAKRLLALPAPKQEEPDDEEDDFRFDPGAGEEVPRS